MSVRAILLLLLALCALASGVSVHNEGSSCSQAPDCSHGLLCKNETCSFCAPADVDSSEFDQDCQDEFGSPYLCRDQICKRKVIWSGFSGWDLASCLTLLIGGALAAGGGVGGGGLFVPILIVLGKFTIKEAVPLSKALIFGAAVCNVAQFWVKKHPKANRKLIDFNLAFILQPLALAGTLVGVILNIVLPNIIILILLVIVLAMTTWRTLKKGISLWKAENKVKTKMQERLAPLQEEDEPEELSGIEIDDQMETTNDSNEEMRNRILAKESQTPWILIVTLFVVLTFTSICAIFKGGGSGKSAIGVEGCTWEYWFLLFLPFPFLVSLTLAWAAKLMKTDQLKEQVQYKFLDGDIRWTKKNVMLTLTITFLAGVMASCLGIGGGMLLAPLMLELKVIPEVTAATSTFMILFTSSSSVIQYAAFGKLLLDYSLVYIFIGAISAFVGQKGIDHLMKKYGRTSYLVLLIGGVIALSSIFLVAIGAQSLWYSFGSGDSFKFHPLC